MRFLRNSRVSTLLIAMPMCSGAAAAAELCQGYGPQTPRDISDQAGTNVRIFTLAPGASQMNLCDVQ